MPGFSRTRGVSRMIWGHPGLERPIKELRINQAITSPRLVLIDEEGKSQGIVNYDQAMFLAYEAGLDLVEVNSNANPPVAKIMDYGKYRYTQEKQQSKQKVKSRGPELKEVRLGFKTSEHDLDFKAKRAKKFLDEGNKVKLTIKLVGREMMFQNKIKTIVNDFMQRTGSVPESPVERQGNRFSTIMVKGKNETKNS